MFRLYNLLNLYFFFFSVYTKLVYNSMLYTVVLRNYSNWSNLWRADFRIFTGIIADDFGAVRRCAQYIIIFRVKIYRQSIISLASAVVFHTFVSRRPR